MCGWFCSNYHTLSGEPVPVCSSPPRPTNKESKPWKDVNVAEQIGLKMAKSKRLEAQHALKRNSLGKHNPQVRFNTLHSLRSAPPPPPSPSPLFLNTHIRTHPCPALSHMSTTKVLLIQLTGQTQRRRKRHHNFTCMYNNSSLTCSDSYPL